MCEAENRRKGESCVNQEPLVGRRENRQGLTHENLRDLKLDST